MGGKYKFTRFECNGHTNRYGIYINVLYRYYTVRIKEMNVEKKKKNLVHIILFFL